MAKPKDDKPARPNATVDADRGEFVHQAEGAEVACVTQRPAATCACGLYDLTWAE